MLPWLGQPAKVVIEGRPLSAAGLLQIGKEPCKWKPVSTLSPGTSICCVGKRAAAEGLPLFAAGLLQADKEPCIHVAGSRGFMQLLPEIRSQQGEQLLLHFKLEQDGC